MDGLNTKLVDTQDPQFQKLPEYKPDKESTWKHSREEDGWTRSHNCIRMELTNMQEALEDIGDRSLQDWEYSAMQVGWRPELEIYCARSSISSCSRVRCCTAPHRAITIVRK